MANISKRRLRKKSGRNLDVLASRQFLRPDAYGGIGGEEVVGEKYSDCF